MKVLILGPYDFGGLGAALSEGLKALGHECIVAKTMHSYLGYPCDYYLDDIQSMVKVKQMAKDMDVIVLHETFYGGYKPPKGPKLIHYLHGTYVREAPNRVRRYLEKYPGRVILSTADLKAQIPEGEWFAAPIPVDRYEAMAEKRWWQEYRISHSTTKPNYHKTKWIIDAVGKLRNRQYKVKLTLTQMVSHKISLTHKVECDVFFDRIGPYYGVAAFEAASMHKPVIFGFWSKEDEELFGTKNCYQHQQNTEGEFPFYLIDGQDELYDALIALMDPDLRREVGDKGFRYVKKIHDISVRAKAFVDMVEGM